jgi:hypothetical protein
MSATSTNDNPIIGTWRLVDYEVPGANPDRRRPLGTEPLGLLIYTSDGYMSAQYMPGDRPHLAAARWHLASDAEKLAAADGYGGYGGRYEWLGDRVVHYVEASLFPNWIGASLVRLVEFDGPTMIFSAEQKPDRPPTPVLRWQRRG